LLFEYTTYFNLQSLLVAQIDNIETSACLVSPQHVKYGFFLLSYFNCMEGCTWMLTGTILHLCSFLLNGKGIDTRTSLRMVCFSVWTHSNASSLDCFKGVTPVCYIYVILFLRILDHRCPLVWLVFLNLGQIFFKLWVSSTVSI
jgi:hypothetical protein